MIGGMSWESSADYYRIANRTVARELGGLHSAKLLLTSVDFARIEELQRAGDWEQAGKLLAVEARALEAGGADMVLLCTNTMHIVADTVAAAVDIPFLHIIDVTAEAVRAAGSKRVGLLATGFTMEQPFYREHMATHGIEVIVPGPDDRALVHRVIYEELCLGIIRDESRAAYRDVITRLVEAGADGILLACTEIELLISQDDSPLPVFPTTRLHVEAAVARALAG